MELKKTIFKNNKQANIFIYNSEDQQQEILKELINLLLDKIRNRHKIKINCDHIKKTIEALLFFEHEQTGNKYKYTYEFKNIDPNFIYLY